MAALANPKYERFAQLLASGIGKGDAYKEAMGTESPASATRLSKRVSERVDQIRSIIAKNQSNLDNEAASEVVKQLKTTLLSMSERRAFLARVVRCDLSRIDTTKDGDLIQEIIINEQGTKLKLPGKRECLLLDAQLAGEMVEKVDMSLKDKRVLPPEERARLLRESIARRTHGRS